MISFSFLLDLSIRSHVKDRITTYRIKDLGETANKQTFKWEEKNRIVTIQDYYKEHHGIDLEFVYLITFEKFLIDHF